MSLFFLERKQIMDAQQNDRQRENECGTKDRKKSPTCTNNKHTHTHTGMGSIPSEPFPMTRWQKPTLAEWEATTKHVSPGPPLGQ